MKKAYRFLISTAALSVVYLAACAPVDKVAEEAKIPLWLHQQPAYRFGIDGLGPSAGGELGDMQADQGQMRDKRGRLSTVEEILSGDIDEEYMQQMKQYFSDALFIGDSRTVGMNRYSGVDTADYFAATGMSVFNVLTDKADVGGVMTDLPAVLSAKSYGKIYFMLGINELGYNMDRIVEKYRQVVEEIAAMQPQAVIYIQANMHVSGQRSEKDPVYNNITINTLNDRIKSIAEEKNIAFVDANPVFDDENGDLKADYTFDQTHVLGKYYKVWSIWLYENAQPV